MPTDETPGEQIEGQMDVYDVLADIEENGPGPKNKLTPNVARPLTAAEVVAKRLKETQ